MTTIMQQPTITKEQAISVLILISAFCANVKAHETTKKFDKLRTQIRLNINSMYDSNVQKYDAITIGTDDVWELVKASLKNDKLDISIAQILLSLYAFIERTPYANLLFGKGVFLKAVGSIQHQNGFEEGIPDATKLENDSNRLTDAFAKVLKIPAPNGLGLLKIRLQNSLQQKATA